MVQRENAEIPPPAPGSGCWLFPLVVRGAVEWAMQGQGGDSTGEGLGLRGVEEGRCSQEAPWRLPFHSRPTTQLWSRDLKQETQHSLGFPHPI